MKPSKLILAIIDDLTDKLSSASSAVERLNSERGDLIKQLDDMKRRPVDKHIQDAYNAVCYQLADTQAELLRLSPQTHLFGGQQPPAGDTHG